MDTNTEPISVQHKISRLPCNTVYDSFREDDIVQSHVILRMATWNDNECAAAGRMVFQNDCLLPLASSLSIRSVPQRNRDYVIMAADKQSI